MDFLGIGPLELFFIVIIALIIFGPNDIVKAGKTAGSFLRKLVTSDGWKTFQQARKGMSDLPTTLMREAGIDEQDLRELTGYKDLQKATKDLDNTISPWTTPPTEISANLENPEETQSPEKSSQPSTETQIPTPETEAELVEPSTLPSESSTPQNNEANN